MNILELISNPVVITMATSVGSIVAWQAANIIYNHFKLGGLARKNTKKLGNVVGLQMKKYVLDNIKDQALRAKVKADLDASGDEFDAGFDAGLNGIKL